MARNTWGQGERPSWDCACVNEHVETRDRAWCSACSEWCYEDAPCVRGELDILHEFVRWVSENGDESTRDGANDLRKRFGL
jgi:hypothetical protein